MIHNKGVKLWTTYACRKDKQPLKKYLNGAKRRKSILKKHSNHKVRNYRYSIQNGDYKKIFDLWWTIY